MNPAKAKKLLQYYLDLVCKAKENFIKSLEKCKQIDINQDISFEEQESLDSLSSIFARISDILTQKLITYFIILNREEFHTFIDKANFAEKIGIVENANILIHIRDLRNEISHEYINENLCELYKNLIDLSYELLKIVQNSIDYSNKLLGKNIYEDF